MKSMFLDLSAIYLQVVLPGKYAEAFPSLGQTWRDFWQLSARQDSSKKDEEDANRFRQFITSLSGPPRAVLYFLHVEMPHGPWRFFPSGTEYNYSRWSSPLAKEETLQGWGGDQSVAHRAFQRYMIQLSYTDRLLGQMLDHLQAQGLLDPSLLVVTADHGMSFDENDSHRPVTGTNYVDILSVPFFVKLPFQKEAVIDDRNVETVDVPATIADVLGTEPGWKWDGESLLRSSTRKTKRFFSWMMRKGAPYEFPSFSCADSKAWKLKLMLFGSHVKIHDLFRVGPLKEIYGTSVNALRAETTDRIKTEIYNRKLLENVDTGSGFVPALISGKLRFEYGTSAGTIVVLALNGVVRASARSFRVDERTEGFAVLAPENSFRQGRNEVTVLVYENNQYRQLKTGWID
jgi:hypothetical protein